MKIGDTVAVAERAGIEFGEIQAIGAVPGALHVKIDSEAKAVVVDHAKAWPVVDGVLALPDTGYMRINLGLTVTREQIVSVICGADDVPALWIKKVPNLKEARLPRRVAGICCVEARNPRLRLPESVGTFVLTVDDGAKVRKAPAGVTGEVIVEGGRVSVLALLASGCTQLTVARLGQRAQGVTVKNPRLSLFRNNLALVKTGGRRWAKL